MFKSDFVVAEGGISTFVEVESVTVTVYEPDEDVPLILLLICFKNLGEGAILRIIFNLINARQIANRN